MTAKRVDRAAICRLLRCSRDCKQKKALRWGRGALACKLDVFGELEPLMIENIEDVGDWFRGSSADAAGGGGAPGLRRANGTGAKRERTVADVPVGGRRAQIAVQVRRRVCATCGCRPDANMCGCNAAISPADLPPSGLSKEIAQEASAAGASPQQLSQWLRSRWGHSISELPATGLFRELTQQRHLTVGTTWRRNDLTDMVYLSCAAGYADVVVCERHMRTALNQSVRRLRRSTQVLRRLSDAIDPIAKMLDARSGTAG